MREKMKNWMFGAYLLSTCLVFPFPGSESLSASEFPSKPISVVIPLSPGGQNDLVLRVLTPYTNEYIGQTFVVNFRPGGGGAIGSNEVAQAKPDGHTILFGHANCNSVLPAVEGRGKGTDELEAIARICATNSAYWVQADAPWKTFKEMIDWAKANPGKLTYGNTGTWSSTDFSWRWLELKAGFTSRNVPYDGGAKGLVALLGGHVQVGRFASPQSLPHYKAGTIRPLAVGGSQRNRMLPDVPCLLEEGYDMKGLGTSWMAFFAPKGTPRPIIDRLANGFKKMTEKQQAITALEAMGNDFAYLGPDEFAKVWREEYLAYKELAKMFKK
jgi:tripartite-type tricarboxylate transporter receptor subunit TctC